MTLATKWGRDSGRRPAIERTGAQLRWQPAAPTAKSHPGQRSALDATKATSRSATQLVALSSTAKWPHLTDAQLNQVIPEASNNIVKFMESAEAMGREAGNAAQTVGQAAEANAAQASTAEQVQGALAGATQVLMGIGMVAGGISQIQEGGTHNVLLGIGQVLMGVGSAGLGIGRMFAAQGAYVNTATPAMIGEGGTPEYVIPENKMNASMTRWAAGMRGKGVVEGAAISGGSQNRSQAQPLLVMSAAVSVRQQLQQHHQLRRRRPGSDNFAINITGEQLVFNENYVARMKSTSSARHRKVLFVGSGCLSPPPALESDG